MASGPSGNISAAPTFEVDSVPSTTSVTLNLTSIPTNAGAVTFAYRTRATGTWTMATERSATGTFTISSLTDGETYEFIAIPQESTGEVGPVAGPLRVVLNTSLAAFGLEEIVDAVQDGLKAVVWRGSATKVFGDSVEIVSAERVSQDTIDSVRMPGAFVYELGEGGQIADEDPTFKVLRLGVTIFTVVHGDQYGTKVLKGGNRASETTSDGAGLYDMHSMVMQQLGKILRNSTYPARFVGVAQNVTQSQDWANSRRLGSKSYVLTFHYKEN